MPKVPDRILRERFERTMNPWYQVAVDAGRLPEKFARGAPGLGLYSVVCSKEGLRYADPDVEMQFQAFAIGYRAALEEVEAEKAWESQRKMLEMMALLRPTDRP